MAKQITNRITVLIILDYFAEECMSFCDVIAGSTKKYKLDSAVKPQNDPVVVAGCLLMIFVEVFVILRLDRRIQY